MTNTAKKRISIHSFLKPISHFLYQRYLHKSSVNHHISSAKRTIAIEAQSLARLEQHLDQSFADACEAILECQGRVIIMGIGKSGHIGTKIAASLASTGTPAFFVHPSEASHGDLGMITRTDLVIAISYSGATNELLAILPLIKRKADKLLAITGNKDSILAKAADVHLYAPIEQEACPLNLAPTSSTTVTLAMGDALTVALLEARGFTREDFASRHPGGALGQSLLLKVQHIMHTGDRVPLVDSGSKLIEALLEASAKHLGFVGVLGENGTPDHGKLIGIFTDGDLRRLIDKTKLDKLNMHAVTINQVMTREPVCAQADMLAVDLLNLMEHHAVNAVIVLDKNKKPVGALNMLDLVRARVV